MIIKNITVLGEDKQFREGYIKIRDGMFEAIIFDTYDKHDCEPNSGNFYLQEEIIDGQGCYAIPGLIDLHFHGAVGADLSDGTIDAIERIAAYEASVGVTSICPASMTLPESDLQKTMIAAKIFMESQRACIDSKSRLAGINLEGPFISEKKKGAQSADHIKPCDLKLFKRLQNASSNLIKLVSVAPETENAMEFIREVKDDVTVSLAHTTADYEIASKAFKCGARHVTHLYNAMPGFLHRDPGVIGAAYDCPDCCVELICDGVHIHPAVVRSTFQMFSQERVVMISDSMRATGLKDGCYSLGGQEVFVHGNLAKLADGTIAGSVTNLMECVRTAVQKMGIPLGTAVACASMNPAKVLGIYESVGSISPGKYADLVLLDRNLKVKAVYLGGVPVPRY